MGKDDSTGVHRRTTLNTLGVAIGGASLAGCTSILGPSGSPEEVVRELVETLSDLEEGTTYRELLDEFESIWHSEVWGTWKENAEESDALDDEPTSWYLEPEIEEFETVEIVDEDIDPDTAEEEFNDDFIELIPDGDLEENAVVEIEALVESHDTTDTEYYLTVVESSTIRDEWQLASITGRYFA